MKTVRESPEKNARRRKIKKMTGHEYSTLSCSACKRVFTDREIDNDEVVYSVGRLGSIALCHRCFKELYSGGVNDMLTLELILLGVLAAFVVIAAIYVTVTERSET